MFRGPYAAFGGGKNPRADLARVSNAFLRNFRKGDCTRLGIPSMNLQDRENALSAKPKIEKLALYVEYIVDVFVSVCVF